MSTEIAWTDVAWNPTVGCSRVSAGCEHCFAERFAHRGLTEAHRGLTVASPKGPRWTGEVRCLPERLDIPLHWRKPRRVFVDSMSDLFHPEVPFEFVDQVFAVMACTHWHTFQVLTKRPDRMRAYLTGHAAGGRHIWKAGQSVEMPRGIHKTDCGWPFPNVHLGVSCEDQAAADERVPLLLQTPAAVRFLSLEPLLASVSLRVIGYGPSNRGYVNALTGTTEFDGVACQAHAAPPLPPINWVIIGGESRPGARPCDVEWIRSVVEQCREAKVPVFVKQDSGRFSGKQGRIPGELWIKEFPNAP